MRMIVVYHSSNSFSSVTATSIVSLLENNKSIEEVKRRFAADEIDFSEENIKKASISKRYINNDFEMCMKEILNDVKNKKV